MWKQPTPKIDSNVISYFASGESILEIPSCDIDTIRSKTYVITTNYGFERIEPNLNIHSDLKVSEYIANHIKRSKKTFNVLSRVEAFTGQWKQYEYIVDYWFETQLAKGNYTVLWMLAYLKKFFPLKTVLLFGFDFYGMNKWYDSWMSYDKDHRGKSYNNELKLAQCARQLENIRSDKFINCNPKSKLEIYSKKDWREYVI